MDSYAKTRSTPYGVSFEDVCAEVMGKTQTAQLRRLIDFKFKRHSSINLPDWRIDALEEHIQKRVVQLLDISREKKRQKSEPER